MTKLAGSLQELKARVREAVAEETGKAVGEAIRDLLATVLAGRQSTRRLYRPQGDWDERDAWDEDDQTFYATRTGQDDDDRPSSVKASPQLTVALASGAAAVRCWSSRRVPGWVAAIVGVVVGLATLAGGTLACAGVSLLTATVDILPLTESTARLVLGMF
jgi:hypothetical protein